MHKTSFILPETTGLIQNFHVVQNQCNDLNFIQLKNKSQGLKLDFYHRAERTRFELVVGLLLRQFSKLVVSATHPPFHLKVKII